ncbi:C69 family dipeptidase [Lacticaseibacillus pabuli]|uniref:Dipeptidase n=1 Tax=Lacticaseibacillus pabuli TaxID=3025672 RepID=A0ABY7WQQ9_9LACO|nr:C69 family dipeptidase [Lacticaseibacillus sp. KACC 23028]WDF81500.1 C69 family dipeptidase [Lacticaseibacillus sp. KACC 23028]
MTTRSSCTSILIGKKASADGSVIIGRNEDSKASWPKQMVVRPARTETTTFVSKETGVTIPLPGDALSYTATPEWTDQYGLFEEDGINSAGVAMSATESAYANARVLGFDSFTDQGTNEEAMVTITLPYAHTAREGVQRLGDLIAQYGTGEANGILFADHDEAWYMEVVTGHRWAAQRIPDDSFAVVANQLSIQEVDFDSTDFMASADLRDFAAANHLWQAGQPFNLRHIFGTNDQSDRVYNYPRVWYGHRMLAPVASQGETPESSTMPFIVRAEQPLQVESAMDFLSSHYQGTPFDPAARLPHGVDGHRYRPIALAKTQESHVLQLRQDLPAEIANIHWLAMGVPAESQYVPFFAGTTTTPANYQAGALPASMDSAYWQYKLAGVLVDAHFNHFQAKLTGVQGAVHAQHVALIAKTDAQAAGKSAAELAALATTATAEAARLSDASWAKLTMDLLASSTDFSPLNFNTDPNL